MYRDRHRSGEKESKRGRLRRYLKGHRRVSSYPPVIRGHCDRRLHFLLDLPVANVVVVFLLLLLFILLLILLLFLLFLAETRQPVYISVVIIIGR